MFKPFKLTIKRLRELIRLSREAYWEYRWYLSLLLVLGFLSGLVEGIGVNILIPLFSFLTDNPNDATDVISSTIKQALIFFGIEFRLRNLLILIVVLFIAKAIMLLVFNYVRVKITAMYIARTRESLLTQTLRMDWEYLKMQKIGYLENVIMSDVKVSGSMLKKISTMILLISASIVYIAVAINVSLSITLITITLGAVLFFIFKPLLTKTRKIAKKTTRMNKVVAHHINQTILGLKTLKSTTIEKKLLVIAHDYFERLKRFHLKTFFYRELNTAAMQPISIILISIVFAYSYKTPDFSLGAFAVILYLVHRLFVYMQQFQSTLHNIYEAIPYLHHVVDYEKKAIEHRERASGALPFIFEKTIEFENISFAYGRKQVLKKINLTINKGKTVGLIGPSGSGKTTLTDVLMRLITPTDGVLRLDGVSSKTIDKRLWLENISYVSQDLFLINDSIKSNIKLYDDRITDKEVISATKAAYIYDFIVSLPEGFDTNVGEGGASLSVGQRQRIVIARALARKPQILLLDEATSALDNESEVAIKKSLNYLRGYLTIFIVAHRMSTISNTDMLYILENGKIVENGRPDDLLQNKKSYFYKMNYIHTQ